jgi:hypothetical protein
MVCFCVNHDNLIVVLCGVCVACLLETLLIINGLDL